VCVLLLVQPHAGHGRCIHAARWCGSSKHFLQLRCQTRAATCICTARVAATQPGPASCRTTIDRCLLSVATHTSTIHNTMQRAHLYTHTQMRTCLLRAACAHLGAHTPAHRHHDGPPRVHHHHGEVAAEAGARKRRAARVGRLRG